MPISTPIVDSSFKTSSDALYSNQAVHVHKRLEEKLKSPSSSLNSYSRKLFQIAYPVSAEAIGIILYFKNSWEREGELKALQKVSDFLDHVFWGPEDQKGAQEQYLPFKSTKNTLESIHADLNNLTNRKNGDDENNQLNSVQSLKNSDYLPNPEEKAALHRFRHPASSSIPIRAGLKQSIVEFVNALQMHKNHNLSYVPDHLFVTAVPVLAAEAAHNYHAPTFLKEQVEIISDSQKYIQRAQNQLTQYQKNSVI